MIATKKRPGLAWVLSFILTVATIVTPATVYANTPGIPNPIQASFPADVSNQHKGNAIVKAPLDDDRLLVSVNGMDVALNVSEETLAIDSKTGLPASIKDLKINDAIFVYYSRAMTKSIPPQSRAIAIVTRVESDKSHAELFTVREIISRADSDVRALNKEGDLIVTFQKGISMTPYKAGQTISMEDIQVGTQLFIWYEIVAMSYPGQTGATKAVLVGQEEGLGARAVYTPMAGVDAAAVAIEGKAIQLNGKKLMDQQGLLMLPLRAVAEGLGFKVTWQGEDRSILLDDGIVKTTLFIGQDSYFKASSQAIGLTQSFPLGAAPVLIDSSTYVPASLFNFLYSNGGAVEIEIKE